MFHQNACKLAKTFNYLRQNLAIRYSRLRISQTS